MQYDSFSYLWPPRPKKAIDRKLLPVLERSGHIAQVKKNGTCSIIAVSPDRSIITMNRHKEQHRQWTARDECMSAFQDIGGSGWFVFVSELLNNKVKDMRDINYVHDILVHDGKYLVGMTQEDRQDLLFETLGTDDMIETPSHYCVNPHVWLPVEYEGDFTNLFDSLTDPEDEGLVIKNPKQRLALCSRPDSNTEMVKCRKASRNYSF